MAKLEQEIDDLFELPLGEFTSARNALAKRLKGEGDAGGSESVQRLVKPSLPAWAINQLARREEAAVKALLDAGAAMRKAQGQALARKGGGDALRTAQAEEKRAVNDLTRRAARLLETAGRSATASILERISSTLSAAAVTERGRAALEAGRLSGEIEPSGFEALAGLTPTGSDGRSSSGDELAQRRAAKQESARRKSALERECRALERRARAAKEVAERAERAASEARRAAEEAEAAAEAARSELADLD
jgi:hypothetical protein